MNQNHVKELAEYFNITEDQVNANLVTCKKDLSAEYKEKNDDYHRISKSVIYVQMRERPKIDSYLRQIIPQFFLRGDEKILDYGCGVGNYSIPLAEAGFDVTCVEYEDSEIIKFLKWRLKKRYLDDKVKLLGHKDQLPDLYDAVIFYDVLEHLSDPNDTLTKIHRAMRSRALLCITSSIHQGMTDQRIYYESFGFLYKYFYKIDQASWVHKIVEWDDRNG